MPELCTPFEFQVAKSYLGSSHIKL